DFITPVTQSLCIWRAKCSNKNMSLYLNTAHTYRSKWCHPLCVQPRWNKLCLWHGEDQLSYQ
ncbi:hypothetical protein R8N68_27165, partial [Vibrio sp. 1974]|uniref:hypothetical protein n=1 Tax=Vibrio sp. 1974 TaxID=3074584 RepID=UPI0029665217